MKSHLCVFNPWISTSLWSAWTCPRIVTQPILISSGCYFCSSLGLRCCLVILCAVLVTGCTVEHDQFHYDYTTLRMGGLIFAGVMLTMGIIVLLTDFNLFKRKKKETRKVSEPPGSNSPSITSLPPFHFPRTLLSSFSPLP
ncbi:FXYD domain-containing ion transport regulator 6-like [Rhinoderma darwinii]|uniref:FXYD domain-containing ion transport regulator 6-like n=1 Tax=Rhinoderma darwinii TaxID=43563 RepID=UPI003F66D58B